MDLFEDLKLKRTKRQTVLGTESAFGKWASDACCRICNYSLDDKKGKVKVRYCDFCGQPACEECIQALRRPLDVLWDSR